VSLIGVESVRPCIPLRRRAWERLSRDLDKGTLASMTETAPFDEALERARSIVNGKIRGRLVIEIG
jgi:acrylyl-CoA reductase (NADPH)